jgi:hypothetical protein
MVKGRKLEPKWLGPYTVVHKVSDLVYKVRVGTREVNLNVEQLKLCRATREQLRTRRRERRRMLREQQPRPETPKEFDSSSEGEADREETTFDPSQHDGYRRAGPAERQEADSTDVPSRLRRGSERDRLWPERDSVNEPREGMPMPSSGSPQYNLRPRVGRSYKK